MLPTPVLATNRDPATAREKVELGNTAFAMGRSFRARSSFTGLGVGASKIIKVISPIDFDLTALMISVDSGNIRYESLTNVTDNDNFSALTTAFNKNTRSDAPAYTQQLVLSEDGTLDDISNEIILDTVTMRTGNEVDRFKVVRDPQDRRGYGAATFYFRITNLSVTSPVSGVLYVSWDEL
jgi:hypothetical protein